MKRIVIVTLSLIVSAICWAQNIDIVHNLMDKGRYEEALTIIEGLNVVQNNKYSNDIEKIERIVNLYNNALSYYKKDYYSYAITNYEQIIKICSSLSFYVDKSFINGKISIAKKARAEYLKKQQERLLAEERERTRQDSIRRVREQARQLWDQTLKTNTIEAYEQYLNRSPQLIESYKHIALAILRKLYVDKAMKSYEKNDWGDAVWYFNKIKAKYGFLTSSEQTIYDKCFMEREYNSLSYSSPAYWYDRFLKQFPNSEYCADVRGRLCIVYCNQGSFNDAYMLVKSGQPMEWNDRIEDEAWWNDYIHNRKKQYDKIMRKKNAGHKKAYKSPKNLGIMFGVGGSISYMYAGTETVTIESQGATWEEEEVKGGVFLGPKIAFSLGDFYNRFNFEIGFQYAYSGEFGSHIPLSIAPRWNIIADDFHLFVQPEVAYDFRSGGFSYGGRLGLGWYGAFSIGASYNSGFGHMLWQVSYVYYWSW